MELSSSSTTLSGHHLRTVQTTAEGTPFSGSMNTMALCDFDMRRLRRTPTYLCYRIVVCPVCNVGVGLLSVTKRLEGSRCHGGQLSPKRGAPPIFGRCLGGQRPGWIKMPLAREVRLGPGDILLDGDPAPPQRKGHRSPHFSSHV